MESSVSLHTLPTSKPEYGIFLHEYFAWQKLSINFVALSKPKFNTF